MDEQLDQLVWGQTVKKNSRKKNEQHFSFILNAFLYILLEWNDAPQKSYNCYLLYD